VFRSSIGPVENPTANHRPEERATSAEGPSLRREALFFSEGDLQGGPSGRGARCSVRTGFGVFRKVKGDNDRFGLFCLEEEK
jgi:hypothetical protein